MIEFTVPLNFRLSSGIPQVLTGTERSPLLEWAAQVQLEGSPPVALPLVQNSCVAGVLILVNPPLLDLEDPDFLLLWEGVKQFFLELLQPELPPGVLAWTDENLALVRQRLEAQRLGLGLWVISWKEFFEEEHRSALSLRDLQNRTLQVLLELTGPQGGVLHQPLKSCGVFGLNPRVPGDLLAHQIRMSLPEDLQDHPGDFVQEKRP